MNKIRFTAVALSILALAVIACGVSQDMIITPPHEIRNNLPLLSPGLHTGISYSDPSAEGASVVEAAFGQLVEAGMDGYEVNITWADLEPTPGEIDLEFLAFWLAELNQVGIQSPYMVIKTLDTNQLALPVDLIDPQNPQKIAGGRHMDDPAILDRFKKVLNEVVPLLKTHGGFYLSVGNEVDIYLQDHPEERPHFINFVNESVNYIHSIDPEMAAGVNMTWEILYDDEIAEPLIQISDAVSLSYYPLDKSSQGLPPEDIPDHIARMVEISQGKPILLQEVGYPSGVDGDTQKMQNQAAFITILFQALKQHPEFRFVSIQQLSDWPEETCAYFQDYYGWHDENFQNFLCSLGLMTFEGEEKPAYRRFLEAVSEAAGPYDHH